jgi:hypothetical protein
MNIYDVISERFKGLDNLLENQSLGEDDWFNSCTKLTDVLLELARHDTEYRLEPEIRMVNAED